MKRWQTYVYNDWLKIWKDEVNGRKSVSPSKFQMSYS